MTLLSQNANSVCIFGWFDMSSVSEGHHLPPGQVLLSHSAYSPLRFVKGKLGNKGLLSW